MELQRCAVYRESLSVKNLSRLANTCNQIRNLCKNGAFKQTEHTTIMEYLGRRAERFRRNGRLQGEEMEEIISELKGAEEGFTSRNKEDGACVAEHVAVQ